MLRAVATLFRNDFRCRKPGTTFGAGCVWIDSWNYDDNVVGKVLGLPGMIEWAYEIESPAPIGQTLDARCAAARAGPWWAGGPGGHAHVAIALGLAREAVGDLATTWAGKLAFSGHERRFVELLGQRIAAW